MARPNPSRPKQDQPKIQLELWGVGLMVGILGFMAIMVISLVASSPLVISIGNTLNALFTLNSVQTMWYITHASGMVAFRVIHMLSLVAYLGAAIHSVFSGADTSLWSIQVLYVSTFLVVVFMTAHWLIMGALKEARTLSRT